MTTLNPFTLISATPSPYARKVRIALLEKNIPFTVQTEVPWDSTTATPQYNPLEKLPVLLIDSAPHAVYESHFILEWLEAKYPQHSLLPPADDIDARLLAKQIEVVADGMCDALVLAFFEKQREHPSTPWRERQMRKVEGGLRALAAWVDDSSSRDGFLIGNELTLADIAAGSVLGYMAVRWSDHPWQQQYPQLLEYWKRLDARPSFSCTRPSPQTIQDQIV